MTTTTANVSPTQEAAFNKVLPLASALPEEKVRRRGDAPLALENVQEGLKKVLARKADLARAWPPERITRLDDCLLYAQASVFASSRAVQLGSPEGVTREFLTSVYARRVQVLAVLDMAVVFGLVPADRVAAIRAGNGPLDSGQDLVDGVALLREHATALENKTPLTPAWLEETEQMGNRVVLDTRGDGARTPERAAARDADRIWTLLVDAHTELRKAGFELWGDAVNDHVPALLSRVSRGTPGAGAPPTG